jgi:NAD(P)-dependent dehydrogenase (short-subunit alcohol dehydrogenase family)
MLKYSPGPNGPLAGRVAIVTGSSRGIGHAIAARLLADGASVCLTARREEELRDGLAALDAPGRAIAVAGGADDPDHRDAAIRQTLAAFGHVDLLVNNAATNPLHGPVVEADLAAVRKIFEVNVVAALAWTQAVVAASMGRRGGAIVNVASVGGLVAAAGIGPYNASKAALVHLTRQLALELGPGIRVNAVAPAVVKTRFAQALYEEGEAELAALYPLGRLGEPADVASAAAFLLGDDAAWITGQTLVVDGGITLTDPGARHSAQAG